MLTDLKADLHRGSAALFRDSLRLSTQTVSAVGLRPEDPVFDGATLQFLTGLSAGHALRYKLTFVGLENYIETRVTSWLMPGLSVMLSRFQEGLTPLCGRLTLRTRAKAMSLSLRS
jgi:hypothetical protein